MQKNCIKKAVTNSKLCESLEKEEAKNANAKKPLSLSNEAKSFKEVSICALSKKEFIYTVVSIPTPKSLKPEKTVLITTIKLTEIIAIVFF